MGYRYIGNKSKVIDEVLDAIQKNVSRGAVVADLMCGTGSVALKLREAGFRVIANDIMTYSYLV